jgi:hypothetical protein
MAMEAKTKAGFILVYGAWVPIVIWQSSPLWAPRVFGEFRYQVMVSTGVVDVVGWIWFGGMYVVGFYLLLEPKIFSRIFRWIRKRWTSASPE